MARSTPESSGNSEQPQDVYNFAAQYNIRALQAMHPNDYHSFWLVDPEGGLCGDLLELDPQNRKMLDHVYRQLGINPKRPNYSMEMRGGDMHEKEVRYYTDAGAIIRERTFSNSVTSYFRVSAFTPAPSVG